jgi:hypothetical protein
MLTEIDKLLAVRAIGLPREHPDAQDILGEPEWVDLLTPAGQRGLTPLYWSHVRPYGEVNLDTDTRLNLTAATAPGPRAADGEAVRSTKEKA